jgi:sigma-E factor negative regulatory protein RseB
MLWLYWRRIRVLVLSLGAAVAAAAVLVLVSVTLGGPSLPASASRSGGIPPASPLRRYSVPSADTARVHRGLMLMKAAAAACQSVSYHGLQTVAWSSAAGAYSYLIEVWHRSGQPELSEGDNDVDDKVPGAAASNDAAIGVLTVSPRMLTLLRTNYVIEYDGAGTSSGRSAVIVVIRRPDGSLAARYWLDQVTDLPLRREMFDSRGDLVNEGAFIDLNIGGKSVSVLPQPKARAWNAQLTSAGVATLRRGGWTVPQLMAGNMTLIGITRTGTTAGVVVDASYSDGLSVVSVFIQRGELPGSLPGWRQVRLNGLPVYLTQSTGLGERGVAWSAGGFVYTVIADAPAQTVQDVVMQLPHDHDAGFWDRVERGLRRIGSWFDPFS